MGDKRNLGNVRVGEVSVVRVAAKMGSVGIPQRLERLARNFDWDAHPATNPWIQDIQMEDVAGVDVTGDTAQDTLWPYWRKC